MRPSDIEALNSEASALMKRGIRLMGEGLIEEAIDCFDQARQMRAGLPFDRNPLLAYGLAACWLNRAEALIRLADPVRIPEAIRACDEGIALLAGLPSGADARFPRRLAIAYQNRGLAFEIEFGQESEHAISSFRRAIEILESDAAAAIDDRQYLLAAIRVSLANGLAVRGAEEAATIAGKALEFARGGEMDDANAAEAGLKARHVLCRILAGRLELLERVHDATDLVDDGLELARRWEKKGVARFRGIAYDLFRFGARVYARYQPQFLDEFVRENMEPARSSRAFVESEEMRAAAKEALQLHPRD